MKSLIIFRYLNLNAQTWWHFSNIGFESNIIKCSFAFALRKVWIKFNNFVITCTKAVSEIMDWGSRTAHDFLIYKTICQKEVSCMFLRLNLSGYCEQHWIREKSGIILFSPSTSTTRVLSVKTTMMILSISNNCLCLFKVVKTWVEWDNFYNFFFKKIFVLCQWGSNGFFALGFLRFLSWKLFSEFIMWEELALFVWTISIKFELMRLEFGVGWCCRGW